MRAVGVERRINIVAIILAAAWVPFMIGYWIRYGGPEFVEAYVVGVMVIPTAIVCLGRLVAWGVGEIHRLRSS